MTVILIFMKHLLFKQRLTGFYFYGDSSLNKKFIANLNPVQQSYQIFPFCLKVEQHV